jgi:hypothetical protein
MQVAGSRFQSEHYKTRPNEKPGGHAGRIASIPRVLQCGILIDKQRGCLFTCEPVAPVARHAATVFANASERPAQMDA